MSEAKDWFVYIIETSRHQLYTGISTDVKRRFAEHQQKHEDKTGKGARYFNGNEPVRVVFTERHPDRSSASKREYQIKQMSKKQKQTLVSDGGSNACL